MLDRMQHKAVFISRYTCTCMETTELSNGHFDLLGIHVINKELLNIF